MTRIALFQSNTGIDPEANARTVRRSLQAKSGASRRKPSEKKATRIAAAEWPGASPSVRIVPRSLIQRW